ncbi:hypothetical protein HHK36_014889 [Tetracentron sinense]|uniref:HMA domain-containing protein n=1 Tax=Tetracentron sinense TaxID=13715 RepID=A0A834Z672_TETSI|nr:hypothetical protein HHK36_014889 [Tetracentron sinense]
MLGEEAKRSGVGVQQRHLQVDGGLFLGDFSSSFVLSLFLLLQTCILKVNIHCDGCKQKVKKLLQRIEGVYTVNIDAEQQKVTVSGSVDSATLIKKLVRSGKHAEIWSSKSNQHQKQQQPNGIKNEKNNKDQKQGLMKGLKAFQNQHKFPTFSSEEDEDDCEDDEDDDEEEELRILREKASRLGLLRQQANEANNAKKNSIIATAINNGKMNNGGNGNVGKKGSGGGNPNQNMAMKGNTGGIDQQKNMAAAIRMNNALLGGGGGGNPNAGEGRKGNDINAMMGLAGLHGGGGVGLGGNGLGGFQAQPNNGFQGSSAGFPASGFTTGHHPSPMMASNMHGHQYNPSSAAAMMNMNMNMQNRNGMNNMMMNMQQPQMMYNRSPLNPPNTGYYYNYSYAPPPYSHSDNSGDSAVHMFSDENTNSCAVM